MSPLVKAALDWTVKPALDKGIASLKTNQAANVAEIESLVAQGQTIADATASTIVTKLKLNPVETFIADEAIPELLNGLGTALQNVEGDVPAYYAEGLAFLEKEDAYL